MNIVLFDHAELERPLPRSDDRAQHILRVLRREIGESFDVGIVNGPRGKATVAAVTDEAMDLRFSWSLPHAPPPPTSLVLGLPRPQTARDILRDATTLGATALHFVATARSDPNYRDSSLWRDGSWQRHVLLGAAQAFDTHLPTVTWHQTLEEALTTLVPASNVIALDNYGASGSLANFMPPAPVAPVTLCLGPERGWGEPDRASFDQHGIARLDLGERVLRLETAVTAALVLINARRLPSPA